jgi:hypothetical protein
VIESKLKETIKRIQEMKRKRVNEEKGITEKYKK